MQNSPSHSSPSASASPVAAEKSKSVATWLAIVGGTFGAHRFYLYGLTDTWAWLHAVPTLAGLYGTTRMELHGQDDRLAWLLVPLLGLMVAYAMICAITYGLTSDERWAERWKQPLRPTRWLPVLGAVAALLIGGASLMATVAFSGQKFFEAQLQAPASASTDGSGAGQRAAQNSALLSQ